MRGLDFRYVFVGIETADERLHRTGNKRQNLHRGLLQDLEKLHTCGMIVNGGFIVGLDNETCTSARSIADLVENGKICMAMVGLLHALPNTQLAKRLLYEGRLLEDSNRLADNATAGEDQTTMGLNFTTLRPRQLHKLTVGETARMLLAFVRVVMRLGILPPVSYYFRRNTFVVLAMKPACVEPTVNLMGMCIHFQKQSAHIVHSVRTRPR